MITEVQITEGGVATSYAKYCPSSMNVQQWLERLVQGIVIAPSNMRILEVAKTPLTIDRRNVTSVVVTMVAS